MSSTRGFARLRHLVVGSACALVALACAPAALAHATLERSDPGDGTVLAESPGEIHLWFTEEIVPRFSGATILDPDGNALGTTKVQARARGRELTLTVPEDLSRGLYTIDWKVLSADDGHLRRGLVVFGVGAGLVAAPAGERGDGAVRAGEVLLRWLNLLLLSALVGGIAVAGLVLTPSLPDEASALRAARTRVLGWTLVCSVLAVGAGIAFLLHQVLALAGALDGGGSVLEVGWDLVGGTRLGALWLVHELLLLALVGVLLVVRRPGVRGAGLACAASFVIALVVVQAVAGHAAAVSPRTGLAVVAASVHILAAGVWIGGLAAAIVAFWPFRRAGGDESAVARASLRRFGLLAAASVGLLVATGLYYAGRQVASADALLTTLYGKTLLAKTALVLAAGVVGLMTATLLHPERAAPLSRLFGRPRGRTPVGGRRLRGILVAEALLGVAVLALAGVLTAAVPARGPEFEPVPRAPYAVPGSLSAGADDLLVTLTAKPNRAGHNVFRALVASTLRPPPAEIGAVVLRFRRDGMTPTVVRMVETEPGRYRAAGAYLSAPGAWEIDVVVERPGLGPAVAPLDWRTSPPGGRAVLVSNRPVGGLLTAASVLVFLLVALGVGLRLRGVWARRRLDSWETGPLGSA